MRGTRASRGRPNETFGGLSLGHRATERVELLAELHGERIDHSGPCDDVTNLALCWRVDDGGRLLMSYGDYLHD